MDPLWASIIITGGGPGFVTSCWKYFVDANFETENFEWKIYVPGGDWTHVPLTEWYTYTLGRAVNMFFLEYQKARTPESCQYI